MNTTTPSDERTLFHINAIKDGLQNMATRKYPRQKRHWETLLTISKVAGFLSDEEAASLNETYHRPYVRKKSLKPKKEKTS